MENLKVKLITGFRRDQYVTIDAEEAPKAYYLFLNPEKRGVFNNGVAIMGSNIQQIEPDLHATMGWNPEYVITADDHNEIREAGIERKIRIMLGEAKEIAQGGDMQVINEKLEVPQLDVAKNRDSGFIALKEKMDMTKMIPAWQQPENE